MVSNLQELASYFSDVVSNNSLCCFYFSLYTQEAHEVWFCLPHVFPFLFLTQLEF
jgi:hypothetical protein